LYSEIAQPADLEGVVSKERCTKDEQEREAIRKFHAIHPGWNLLQVARCPYCGRPNYCKRHKYAYKKWWIKYYIAMKK